MITTAMISKCGTWRFNLFREWDGYLPVAVFVMLNPSTADDHHDDATIRRCIGFARSWGMGSIEVVNLFAYRSTDPRALASLPRLMAVGQGNDGYIERACNRIGERGGSIVAAWGTHGSLHNRGNEVLQKLRTRGAMRLGRPTLQGHPRHPLYVPNSTKLELA